MSFFREMTNIVVDMLSVISNLNSPLHFQKCLSNNDDYGVFITECVIS